MKIFKEEQRFNQLWLIVLMSISILVPIGIILKTYLEDPKNFSLDKLFSILGILIFAFGVLFVFKLTTRIDGEGIHYQFFPFHWKLKAIKWNEINIVYVRTYSPISEYGGWGLKGGAMWNGAKGKAINVSGNVGIQLELKNGKKLLIGTQKQNDVKAVLATYKTKLIKETINV